MADEQPEDFFDMSMKKKKKKKKKGTFDAGDGEAASAVAETAPVVETPAAAPEQAPEQSIDDLSLMGKKKKKKTKAKLTFEDDEADLFAEGKDEAADNKPAEEASGDPWSGSDRDYTYEELLHRAIEVIRQRNPDMVPGGSKTIVVPAPVVTRISTKRSSFANFNDICKALHRQPEHLMSFVMSELGSPGSLDGQQALVIKGRFNSKQIETVMRRYIREYVTCHTCRSPNTILTKEDRLYFLLCEICKAQCSVATIHKIASGKR